MRVGVEAAVRQGWDAIIGDGPFIGMTGYGASAPYKALYEYFGITPQAVADAALARLGAQAVELRPGNPTGHMRAAWARRRCRDGGRMTAEDVGKCRNAGRGRGRLARQVMRRGDGDEGGDQRLWAHRAQYPARDCRIRAQPISRSSSINDLGPVETNAHLLRFDSVHGRFPA